MIVSDGHVWPPFVAEIKDITVRDWQTKTAARFKRGVVFDKYDKGPYAFGRKIGECQVTRDAYQQSTIDFPDDRYEREGFAWMNAHPWTIPDDARGETWAAEDCSFDAFDRWRRTDVVLWVVEYVILSIEPEAKRRLSDLLQQKPATLF